MNLNYTQSKAVADDRLRALTRELVNRPVQTEELLPRKRRRSRA